MAATVHKVPSNKRTRLVYRECSAMELSSVELRNRFFSIVVAHFHKTEALRPTGVTVSNDADRFDPSGLYEQAREIVFRRLKRQVSNE